MEIITIILSLVILYFLFNRNLKLKSSTREILVILFYINLIIISGISFYVDERWDSRNPQ